MIGVLADSAPLGDGRDLDLPDDPRRRSSATASRPTSYLFTLKPGVDPDGDRAAGSSQPSSPTACRQTSLQKLLDDASRASLTFDRLIDGFMGLGLIVGVAALGVISARVGRRAPPADRRPARDRLPDAAWSRLSFLLESSFIALTAIVVGTRLGLAVAYNVISDSRRTPSWSQPDFRPLAHLG